jgi:hypothetical protein
MHVTLFLADLPHRKRRLKRRISKFCPQLINPLLRLIAFLRTRLLANHFVVVDNRGAIIFLLVVKFGDLVRVSRLLVLENFEIGARLGCFLTLRIMEEEIFKRSLSVRCCGRVLCA